MERSVELRFGVTGAGATLFTLVVEIMGRWSNILLVDASSGTIVDCLHHVPDGPGRARVLMPGEPCLPPPSGGRKDLDEVSPGEFEHFLLQSKSGGAPLAANLVGLGPGLLALAEGRGGGDLLARLREVIAEVRSGEGSPVYYPGRKRVLPFPVPGWTDEAPLPFDTVAEAAEHAFRELREGGERRRLSALLRKDLVKRKGRLRKKQERLAGEAAEDGEVEEFLRAGKALMAVLPQIPRGAETFTVTDPADPGGDPRTVRLNPALSPRRNAEAFFRKARKVRRRSDLARRRIPPLERELAVVEEELEAVDDLSPEELRSLVRRPANPPSGKKSARGRGPSRIREYHGAGGWRILVGKNSAGNDQLTSRVAQPEDIWLHTRDYPGAHVVLKAPGSAGDPPDEILRAAGEAAAWHSGARSEGKADVSYARRKHVRKVKGHPPGKVVMTKSQTLRVTPRIPEGFVEITGVSP
jgi:predicted ribosome quality control (RQC) complex YloA/Tae2 family protein